MSEASSQIAQTGAEALLLSMKNAGIECLYANAGTDFTPVIEAFARLDPNQVPQPITVTHETAAVAMAHGHYLASGRMQAVMVHVNVGLANSVMGLINAAADNIPLLMLSGRTPLTEVGRPGSRRSPVQYGQEMYDQSSMVSEIVKFHYELRYPEQAPEIIRRAVEIAMSEPRGPVYVSLPREPLAEELGLPVTMRPPVPATVPSATAQAVESVAKLLRHAIAPLIIAQRADPAGAAAIAHFALRHAVPVVEPFTVRNVLDAAHPMSLGHDVGAAIRAADVVLVLDSPVPWLPAVHGDQQDRHVIHVGFDPLFTRLPVRGHQADLMVTGSPSQVLPLLCQALGNQKPRWKRHSEETARDAQRRRAELRAATCADRVTPMSAERLSLCLSEIIDDDTLIFNELGLNPELLQLKRAGQLFTIPHSGGLGWGLPAALGAQMHDRNRLVVACVGDGSFLFANPVACLQAAEALELPVLIVIDNNAAWDAVRVATLAAYPDGASSRRNRVPLIGLNPSPDFAAIARASRAHGYRVESAGELCSALSEAIKIIRAQRRPVLLDVATRVADVVG